MASVKINMSIDSELLARVDEFSKSLSISRSAFIALACNKYLQAEAVTPQFKDVMSRAFRDMADKLSGSISDEEYASKKVITDSELEQLRLVLDT